MRQEMIHTTQVQSDNAYLVLGAGLAVVSMILIPAMAVRMGLGSSLTGALRIALMRASSRVTAVTCKTPDCDA